MSDVYVYIYDLSKGLASQLSLPFLGKHISGIWHTGIVVFGKEIYFGSNGIESCPPNGTILGNPNERLKLGNTFKEETELEVYLKRLSENRYHESQYDLLKHNCNTFSNELGIWLTGQGIPDYITNLPREILDTPFGQMIKPYFEQYSPTVSLAYKTVARHYHNSLNNPQDVCSMFYKQRLCDRADFLLKGEIQSSQTIYGDIIRNLIISIRDSLTSSFIQEEILYILEFLDSFETDFVIVVFDVLRLFILNELDHVVVLFVDPIVWMRKALCHSINDEINNFKCKFICNLVAKHSETISLNDEVLKTLINFAMIHLHYPLTLQTASSLLRNIVINVSTLNDESVLEIGSCLIHILTEEEMLLDEITEENIIGSIYYLVKKSQLVKDLAKAQDIDKRIRIEAPYCQWLLKELQ